MTIALIAIDKENAQQVRLDNREAHLAYISETGSVESAGPFLDENGNMTGSLLILSFESMSDAENWAANDPYALAGLFQAVTLRRWKKVID